MCVSVNVWPSSIFSYFMLLMSLLADVYATDRLLLIGPNAVINVLIIQVKSSYRYDVGPEAGMNGRSVMKMTYTKGFITTKNRVLRKIKFGTGMVVP